MVYHLLTGMQVCFSCETLVQSIPICIWCKTEASADEWVHHNLHPGGMIIVSAEKRQFSNQYLFGESKVLTHFTSLIFWGQMKHAATKLLKVLITSNRKCGTTHWWWFAVKTKTGYKRYIQAQQVWIKFSIQQQTQTPCILKKVWKHQQLQNTYISTTGPFGFVAQPKTELAM
jgi:RNA polymerase subunit RPABC4/transcription elongation factor Spt4